MKINKENSGEASDREKSTDWTAYYSKPKSIFSVITQRFTLQKLIYFMEKYVHTSADIMELGGGNSCFAKALVKQCKVPVKSYSIADSCEVAVSRFKEMKLAGNAYQADLRMENVMQQEMNRYDVVYSVGLIEHYRGKDIAQIIKTHFSLCKEKGIVLISVPTPSVSYRMTRKIMEKCGWWEFPDEKPLKFRELEDYIKKVGKGIIIEKMINYRLPLTQLIVVAMKQASSDKKRCKE